MQTSSGRLALGKQDLLADLTISRELAYNSYASNEQFGAEVGRKMVEVY